MTKYNYKDHHESIKASKIPYTPKGENPVCVVMDYYAAHDVMKTLSELQMTRQQHLLMNRLYDAIAEGQRLHNEAWREWYEEVHGEKPFQ